MRQSLRALIKSVVPQAVESRLRRAQHGYRLRRFKPYVKPITTDGLGFDFLIADPVGQASYDTGDDRLMSQDMLFIRDQCINEGDIVFNCGAHHGFVALLLSRWTGDTGAVLAFEPIPQNASTIRSNIQLNHIHNIVVEEKAIGETDGWAYFTPATNTRTTDESRAEYRVTMTHLDAYAHLKPHFLLIDVQGHEIEVLRGARQVLKRHPKLVIAIHPDKFDAPSRRINELFSLVDIDAYDTWIQWNPARAPEPYDRRDPITTRVHLYAIPRKPATQTPALGDS